MSRFWNARVHGLSPYVPGEQPRMSGLIKLNTNELPYGPSPRVLEAIRAETGDTLRLYPDPTALALRETIGRHHDVSPAHVFVGNGSDEVLAHAFRALIRDDAPVLYPDVSYSFYPVYAGLFGLETREVPLTPDLCIDVADYTGPCGGIVIANPNAPTGIPLSLDAIRALVTRHPDCTVIVDEAYVDFGGTSAIPLVRDHDNLLVVQTLSKSRALAGLRVGFAIGHPDLIDGLTRVKDSFNSYPLDRLAQVGAIAAIEDEAWLQQTTARVIASREQLVAGLAELDFETLPSATNFILTHHPDRPAADLAAALREQAIIVRHLRHPRIADFLRITVGTDAECDRLLTTLRTILGR
ncbi:histidinol-phosphate transaminase [Tanticharoenia sakaeratensis]|uniref:Histidinol-phosphate aminotransferase n=1 Tax=Tanticharoenia sakaeratensis NBRC 103193 TaxID=1231623 RepID=A0A0D6MKD5_9PROT|nr:histidinol-phosphate transaminase [Tanticharoenia sakaeratensis]GAN54134.1 histidinol-phosphate aminotransferase [Tanticharoenia sakaeratensis NBRC 103193]GBQ19491.1 histidinol phosphate aminotransferase [Tanticharoenia sakaeratensis NBRC 103193]